MPWLNMRAVQRFPGVNYIHPLKQREVEQLIEKMRECPQIMKAVVFGSSTESRCTPFSDIDVLLYGEPCPFQAPVNESAYDILWERNLPADAEIRDVIAREGVVVYEA